MVIIFIHMDDRFFNKTFPFADISMDITFQMLFLNLSNVKVYFIDRKIRGRLDNAARVFLTTRWVELVGKKNFVVVAFD